MINNEVKELLNNDEESDRKWTLSNKEKAGDHIQIKDCPDGVEVEISYEKEFKCWTIRNPDPIKEKPVLIYLKTKNKIANK